MTNEQLEQYKQDLADSKFLIANDPDREIDEVKMMETFEHFITTIESQQAEIDKLNMFREDYRKTALERIAYQESQIESLKAITELAVKALNDIKSFPFVETNDDIRHIQRRCSITLSEIERIRNAQT
jgi:hypothetical protein